MNPTGDGCRKSEVMDYREDADVSDAR